ncbi:DNA repair protein UVH3 isoform X2 [Humulus lupulus]|uniref:DNA repair protein UVH3 isoform X2 n=1 Tax=Humulus lupulus TaxID=3486 RepID=UPI002B40DC71|nr:DNA repair protein UVH3 isoform X2 [Humulus lupulus]
MKYDLANNSTKSTSSPCEEDGWDDEEMILPDMHGVDPAVLAALAPSLQLDVKQKQKQDNVDKGKKIVPDKAEINVDRDDSCNQEKLDEMLAASLMEEESRSFYYKTSTSSAPYPVEEDGDMDEDENGDEEMILPAMDGEVDPSILAALPPSMQLDLLVQIRERLMAENRQKYQKVKKDPAKFSELQIEAYLKTVAFRREIDQVQKVASGRGVDGVQTSRIASEANREFIFSSSFTGDKQVLSARSEKYGDKQQAEDPSSAMHAPASTSKSNTVNGTKPNNSRRVFEDNIETYHDERGRIRVSRVRAMGIRMTRDLQRNLDLMKEIENERTNVECLINESNPAVLETSSGKKFPETSSDGAESVTLEYTNEDSVVNNGASVEISFEDDGDIKYFEGDDEIFAHLVAENPLKLSSDNIMSSRNLSCGSDSDCSWEEGTTEVKDKSFSDDDKLRTELPSKGNNNDDSEVEWEEGVCEFTEHTSSDSKKVTSKGNLEEDAELQEAIRRSLEDLDGQKSYSAMPEDDKLEVPKGYSCEGNRIIDSENKVEGPVFSGDDGRKQNRLPCEILDDVENLDDEGLASISKSSDSSGSPKISRILIGSPCEVRISSLEQPLQDANKSANLSKEAQAPFAESVAPLKAKEVNVAGEDLLCTSNKVEGFSSSFNKFAKDGSHTSVLCDDSPGDWVEDQKIATEAKPSAPLVETTNKAVYSLKALTNDLACDIENEENLTAKKSPENCFQEIGHSLENSSLRDNDVFRVEVTEASLEEEIQVLAQERMALGDEQGKLERNAESVSSEMFTECQELLQMFGLPYIIAPMEAEAQCAYMELANLVDGVVTDDSDVFLFGARSVYKNIFDDRKYVETYFMKDVEKELGLTREQLIRMALLLGSDYTEGVSGIGIVNAIEVVHAFPEEDGLQKFRDWIESPDPTILGKFDNQTDSTARKRGSKMGDNVKSSKSKMEEASASHENISEAQEQKQSADHTQDIKKVFMDKHRKVSKNWHIPPIFPSEAVISAYICPQVDKSTEPFTWGKPDHFVLRKLCWDKFCWGSQKADDLLLPVLKEYNKHETQLRLEAFYTFNERFAKIRSKRIKKAVKGIAGKPSLEMMDDAVQEVSGTKKKRERPDGSGDNQSEKFPQETEQSVVRNQSNYRKKSIPKQSKKQKIPRDGLVSESPTLLDDREEISKKSRVSGSCRGRGRGRIAGRGKGKGVSKTSSSSSDGENENDEDVEEIQVGTLKRPLEVRKSTRLRKPVNYTANDSDIDDLDKLFDQGNEKYFDGKVSEQDLCENADSSLGQNEKDDVRNPSPRNGLDEDYLAGGGGFCPDNGKNDQPSVSQLGDSHLEADACEDYKAGGGFCMEESETSPDDNSISGQVSAAVLDNSDLFHCSGMERSDACISEQIFYQANSTVNDEESKSRGLLPEKDEDYTQTTPVGTLHAMPYLRKKRRKS